MVMDRLQPYGPTTRRIDLEHERADNLEKA